MTVMEYKGDIVLQPIIAHKSEFKVIGYELERCQAHIDSQIDIYIPVKNKTICNH